MNRKSHWVLAGVSAAIGAAALAGAGLAQAGEGMHARHGTSAQAAATDPAAMDAHFEKMFAELLPDATPDQKARLTAIGRTVHADFGAVHAQFGEAHRRTLDLLLRPTVDRTALEAARVEQLRQIDVVSRRLVGAMADAAEVLTPEQRARIAAHHHRQ
jgi:protein CpxP